MTIDAETVKWLGRPRLRTSDNTWFWLKCATQLAVPRLKPSCWSYALACRTSLPPSPVRFNQRLWPIRFELASHATDPESQNIVYSLRRAPPACRSKLTQASFAGHQTLSSWRAVVTIAATDTQSGIAIQSFEIETIAANSLPHFISSPVIEVVARGEYRYATRVTDSNLDPIRYELIEGPAGMSIDGLGQVHWATNLSDLGVHAVKLRASDPRGGSSEQAFAVRVIPDSVRPRLSVVPAALVVRANSPEVFEQFHIPPVYPSTFVRVSASDKRGCHRAEGHGEWSVDGIGCSRLAHFRFEDWGFTTITVVAQALDAAAISLPLRKPLPLYPLAMTRHY